MKYKLEFTDMVGGKYEVRIFNNNTGIWKDLVPASSPLTIRSTKGELVDPVFGTGVQIGIMVDSYDTISQAEYEAIFTAPPQTWKVEVRKDTVVMFLGFVDTELYQETFIAPPYTISLTASDGLKGLKNYEPDLEGYDKISDIISKCLLKTGLDLPVWCMNTLTAEDLSIILSNAAILKDALLLQNKSLFQFSQVSDGAFAKKDALNILEDILRSFNCKIYQQAGEWHVDRLDDKYYRGYDKKDICINKTLAPKTRALAPVNVGDVFIGRGQQLEVNPPYGKQTIIGALQDRDYINNPLARTIDYTIPLAADNTLDAFDYPLSYFKRRNPTATQNTVTDIYKMAVDSFHPFGKYMFKPLPMEDRYKVDNPKWEYNDMLTIYPPAENKPIDIKTGEPYGFPYMPHAVFNKRLIERNAISFPFWVKNYKSDSLNISMKMDFKLFDGSKTVRFPDTTGQWDPADSLYLWTGSNTSKDYKGATVGVFFTIMFGDGEYLLFDENNGYHIGAGDAESRILFIGKNVLITDTSVNIDINIQQSIDKTANRDIFNINETLSNYEDITVSIVSPFSLYMFANSGGDITLWRKAFNDIAFNGDVAIYDLKIKIDEKTKYVNTFTGVLQQNYLRPAETLNIKLWNPTRIGENKEDRGLVSSTSNWVNINKASNIHRAYGSYLDPNNLDSHSGLGLFYDIKELHGNGYSSTDLGHRLPVVLLNSWFNLFSDTQDMITGVLKTNELLNFDNTYNIRGRENKQFIMIKRSYDCKNCQQKATFHELKDEEINTNV